MIRVRIELLLDVTKLDGEAIERAGGDFSLATAIQILPREWPEGIVCAMESASVVGIFKGAVDDSETLPTGTSQ